MRRVRWIRYAAVALAVTISATAAVEALADDRVSRTTSHPALTCPLVPVPPRYGPIDEVIAAARRLIVRGSINVQGETTPLTKKNSPVMSVVNLAQTPVAFPGTASLRATATRRCGARTAAASWAVMITVPDLTPEASTRLAFLVKTKTGWRKY